MGGPLRPWAQAHPAHPAHRQNPHSAGLVSVITLTISLIPGLVSVITLTMTLVPGLVSVITLTMSLIPGLPSSSAPIEFGLASKSEENIPRRCSLGTINEFEDGILQAMKGDDLILSDLR